MLLLPQALALAPAPAAALAVALAVALQKESLMFLAGPPRVRLRNEASAPQHLPRHGEMPRQGEMLAKTLLLPLPLRLLLALVLMPMLLLTLMLALVLYLVLPLAAAVALPVPLAVPLALQHTVCQLMHCGVAGTGSMPMCSCLATCTASSKLSSACTTLCLAASCLVVRAYKATEDATYASCSTLLHHGLPPAAGSSDGEMLSGLVGRATSSNAGSGLCKLQHLAHYITVYHLLPAARVGRRCLAQLARPQGAAGRLPTALWTR